MVNSTGALAWGSWPYSIEYWQSYAFAAHRVALLRYPKLLCGFWFSPPSLGLCLVWAQMPEVSAAVEMLSLEMNLKSSNTVSHTSRRFTPIIWLLPNSGLGWSSRRLHIPPRSGMSGTCLMILLHSLDTLPSVLISVMSRGERSRAFQSRSCFCFIFVVAGWDLPLKLKRA